MVPIDCDRSGLEARTQALAGHAAGCLPLVLDATDEASVASALDDAISRLGRVDILVNNAAHEPGRGALDALDPAEWESTLAVNLGAAFLLSRRVLPLMRRQRAGVVVNVAS